METILIAVIVGLVSYVVIREKKPFDRHPQIKRKKKLPKKMSDSEYLAKVLAENNEKERVGKLQAENRERIKKDFL